MESSDSGKKGSEQLTVFRRLQRGSLTQLTAFVQDLSVPILFYQSSLSLCLIAASRVGVVGFEALLFGVRLELAALGVGALRNVVAHSVDAVRVKLLLFSEDEFLLLRAFAVLALLLPLSFDRLSFSSEPLFLDLAVHLALFFAFSISTSFIFTFFSGDVSSFLLKSFLFLNFI